jgi:hypothetical protein
VSLCGIRVVIVAEGSGPESSGMRA